jgi:hypothetical protein
MSLDGIGAVTLDVICGLDPGGEAVPEDILEEKKKIEDRRRSKIEDLEDHYVIVSRSFILLMSQHLVGSVHVSRLVPPCQLLQVNNKQ